MEQPSDRDLWHRASSGSDAAFGALFERHGPAVYNYCFRRTGNWSAAEDLMAATFLEAWRKRDEVHITTDSLRPWLLGVATNLMRNQRRSNRRREAALQRVRIDALEPNFVDDVAGRIDDERRMTELLNVLSRMPLREREVIVLVDWSALRTRKQRSR
jgi:RNA polymerase sigma factor (sigma-70 family)